MLVLAVLSVFVNATVLVAATISYAADPTKYAVWKFSVVISPNVLGFIFGILYLSQHLAITELP